LLSDRRKENDNTKSEETWQKREKRGERANNESSKDGQGQDVVSPSKDASTRLTKDLLRPVNCFFVFSQIIQEIDERDRGQFLFCE
jgi:hypothetical protein